MNRVIGTRRLASLNQAEATFLTIAWSSYEYPIHYQTEDSHVPEMITLFSVFGMTRFGNTNKVVLARCRLCMNMINGVKLLYC